MRRWTKNEDEFILKNFKAMEYSEIAEILNRSKQVVKDRVYQLTPDRKKGFWKKEEDKILIENYGNITYDEIYKLVPLHTKSSIKARCAILGLKNKETNFKMSSLGNRKHERNSNFFNITNITNSYYAGFIAADGCLSEDNEFKIAINSRDKDFLFKFKDEINYTGEIHNSSQYNKEYNKYIYMSCINFNSPEYIVDLEKNFNITPRKTFTLKPPFLQDINCIKSFIIGYIDGDGCIRNTINKYKTKEGIKYNKSLSISIRGTEDMMNWIKYYFDKWRLPAHSKSANICKSNGCYSYSIGSRRAYEIGKILLECSPPYYFERKWNKIISSEIYKD